MLRIRSRLAVALAATVVLGLAGGAGDGTTDGGSGSAAATTGGTATAYYTSFPDSLDPALSYTVEGWHSLWLAYTPLLTFKHVEGVRARGSSPAWPACFRRSPTAGRRTR